MPSFDIISEIDMHEVSNAIDQANREIQTRFDFKGSESEFSLEKNEIILKTDNEFQLKQMREILLTKLSKRQIDIGCLETKDPVISGKTVKQNILLRQGIDTN